MKRGFLVAGLMVLLVLSAFASLYVGTRSLSAAAVSQAIFHPAQADDAVVAILWSGRIPRAVVAIVVGGAMALSGALIQGATRNPLADPGILGITAGAVCAVIAGTFFFGVSGGYVRVGLALAGAILAAFAVFAASRVGGRNPASLVLVGVAVTSLATAFTTVMILRSQASLEEYRFWTAGGVERAEISALYPILPLVVVGMILAFVHAVPLNVLSTGDDAATALGVNVARSRRLIFAAAVILAAAGGSIAGGLAFVGLVVPHIVRMSIAPDHRWLLPASIPAGGIMLLGADMMGRVVARPNEIQAGIIMAFVGVPMFIALARRRSLVAL